jgi:hypothetical protein
MWTDMNKMYGWGALGPSASHRDFMVIIYTRNLRYEGRSTLRSHNEKYIYDRIIWIGRQYCGCSESISHVGSNNVAIQFSILWII